MDKNHTTQPKIALSVETSGRTGSVAIGIGEKILGQISFSTPMRHSAELFPAVSGLLDRIGGHARDVRQIYISAGPGSFTGIRIAVTFAKTFHFANNAEIVAVNTMALIADNANDYIIAEADKIRRVATVLDAKRGQFFIAVFNRQNSLWEKQLDDCLMTADEFVRRFARKNPVYLLGEGLVFYYNAFKAPCIRILDRKYWFPSAEKLYHLGRKMADRQKFADPVTLVPFYLRKPQAKEKGKSKT